MRSTDLTTFLSVAEHATTAGAAETLHVSQPAVSRRIRRLEEELGTPLFDRVANRLVLNQAGTVFRPRAQTLLGDWQNARNEVLRLTDEIAGTLTMATSHHIGLHRLPPALTEFRRRHPNVQINMTFEDSEVAHDLVREGRIELAVATLDPEGSDLAERLIWKDPLVFVANVPMTVGLVELAEMPCVLPGTGTYTGRIVLERFLNVGLKLSPTMSTNYLETIHMLVKVGTGWSVLPRSMCGDLHEIEVEGEPISRDLGVITDPRRTPSNAAQAFIEVLDFPAVRGDAGDDP